jgi:hypothetical protein
MRYNNICRNDAHRLEIGTIVYRINACEDTNENQSVGDNHHSNDYHILVAARWSHFVPHVQLHPERISVGQFAHVLYSQRCKRYFLELVGILHKPEVKDLRLSIYQ